VKMGLEYDEIYRSIPNFGAQAASSFPPPLSLSRAASLILCLSRRRVVTSVKFQT